ncbi:uncharacterized protein PV07_10907 [Cladophialophora immunda]|uniref:SnoaL-like domain-containing protein n=1 Tax=Cladophialophora immunda TaxID=569365 RepID=A0A0D2ACQ9_9EURO|nr:uncharacterized protein PV07_10907 [Cladophialophora immunda]KIW22627.1 hypothetical protein PV07_10907 [Cladophialophora immunda]OQV02256.1 SnoaL-like domain-containing protein [Cladophialophora immunda]
MASTSTFINLGASLTPREAAADAIYRFTQALDDNDSNLLRSSITLDAMVDRSGLSSVTGRDLPPTPGIDLIERFVLGTIGLMDTSHHVSNVRVKLAENQNQAEVTCYVVAEHYKAGEGHDPTKSMHLSVGTRYRAEVVEDNDGLWKIRKVDLVTLWSIGDLGVFGM